LEQRLFSPVFKCENRYRWEVLNLKYRLSGGWLRTRIFKRDHVETTITAYKAGIDAAADVLRGKLDMVVIGDFVAPGVAADGNDTLKKLRSRAHIVPTERDKLMFGVPSGTENPVRTKPNTVRNVLTSLVKAESHVRHNPDNARKITQKILSPRVSLSELEKGWVDYAFEVNPNQALVPAIAGQAQWLSSKRQSVTGKLPHSLYYRELEALNHAKPGAVSIIH
jgi:ABC-type nitrate/sulfonate/bicarbonate transport system substrate-binding protein